jgi:hypothetical protein
VVVAGVMGAGPPLRAGVMGAGLGAGPPLRAGVMELARIGVD